MEQLGGGSSVQLAVDVEPKSRRKRDEYHDSEDDEPGAAWPVTAIPRKEDCAEEAECEGQCRDRSGAAQPRGVQDQSGQDESDPSSRHGSDVRCTGAQGRGHVFRVGLHVDVVGAANLCALP